MLLRAILFDIDGTLIDSNDLHVAAWVEALARHGQHVDAAAVHAQMGKGGDNLIPALFPELPPLEQQRLADAHGPVFKAKYMDRALPFPGARELLAAVRADGIKVVLATSASAEELEHHLDALDARGLVDAMTSADDVARSKPTPDIFVAALAKAGVGAAEALVIGDTPYDIEAANGAAVAAIGVVSGGFPTEVLMNAGARTTFADAAAVLSGRQAAGESFWQKLRGCDGKS